VKNVKTLLSGAVLARLLRAGRTLITSWLSGHPWRAKVRPILHMKHVALRWKRGVSLHRTVWLASSVRDEGSNLAFADMGDKLRDFSIEYLLCSEGREKNSYPGRTNGVPLFPVSLTMQNCRAST
jgi:hypothetical protein